MTATDTLGSDGTFHDPLWRVTVELTALEQELLRCWWVRRLGFIAHAGAAVITTTQSYSRLEHSLGLLALVAHFAEDDHTARAAALLHDIGHLPFSHTFEGIAGLDHHELGARRIRELGSILDRHGIDAADVIAVEKGQRRSVLCGAGGGLRLDHLESFVRSGRAHGRTLQPPPVTLAHLEVVDGAVHTDRATASYLADLVAGEARLHCSDANVLATGVMRHLASELVNRMPPPEISEVAAMTDDEFSALLLSDPRTAATAEELRRDPAGWIVDHGDAAGASESDIEFSLTRLYLDLPVVDGHSFPMPSAVLAALPALPVRRVIRRRG